MGLRVARAPRGGALPSQCAGLRAIAKRDRGSGADFAVPTRSHQPEDCYTKERLYQATLLRCCFQASAAELESAHWVNCIVPLSGQPLTAATLEQTQVHVDGVTPLLEVSTIRATVVLPPRQQLRSQAASQTSCSSNEAKASLV